MRFEAEALGKSSCTKTQKTAILERIMDGEGDYEIELCSKGQCGLCICVNLADVWCGGSSGLERGGGPYVPTFSSFEKFHRTQTEGWGYW